MMGEFSEKTDGNRSIHTEYRGPVRISTFKFAAESVKLVRPEDPDRLLNDSKVLALNHAEDYMPYWAYLWPGAYLLADCVARESWADGTRTLEIGCGLGLAGLVGIQRGLRVDFTDYDEAPLDLIRRSLAENGFPESSATAFRLDWRTPGNTRYPLILGADVLYEKRLVPLVCDVIRDLLEPGGFALVAGPYRVATEGLNDSLRSRGLVAVSKSIACVSEELGAIRGTLHRITQTT